MSYALSPSLLRDLERDLEPRIERAANSGAEALKANVSAGSRSGRHYSNLPRQSSAPGEFYQEQSGEFRDAVAANPTSDPLTWQVGVFGLDQARLTHSEFGLEAQGGRKNLGKTFEDNAVLEEMEKALGG